MSERYVVGIDLGTTHCAISSADLARPKVRLVQVPQLVAPGEVASRDLLPSFTYLASPEELNDQQRTLPWGTAEHVVGEAARKLGAKIPSRLVSSAKSWVCHGGVNRRAPILPWNAPTDAMHLSPFDAQVGYLAHLRAVWDARYPDTPLAEQDVVVTVPASFDEGARELTTQAADAAGLGAIRLLEEPQAAFYDFLGAHAEDLGAQLEGAKLILVVDVGGGTTDLTLLVVRHEGEQPSIERIAVGGHLMLGGDNMDAALAMRALEIGGHERPRDASVWSALVQSARQAKELLLAADAPDQATISFTGRGSKLIASTKSIVVTREDAHAVLLDGFLPHTSATETAERSGRAGLTTLGLPYTQDTAIGRHVCSFLRRHAKSAEAAGAKVSDGLPRPDRVLLNGGVFNAPAMIERLGEVMRGWYGEDVERLDHTSLETAVAHGAVRSALARRGIGELIGGGTARAYYIGIDAGDGAKRALCVAPRGMEDDTSVDVPDRVFDLLVGQPVAFSLFGYTGERSDPPGTLIDLESEDDALDPLPALETTLRDREGASADTLPVTLRAAMTETGALQLFLSTIELPPRRWKLDFVLETTAVGVGEESEPDEDAEGVSPQLPVARGVLATALTGEDPKRVKSLRRDIEKVLGPRGQWNAATCRALWDALLDHEDARGVSEAVELNWLRLVGWTLRPGFGAPEDDARVDRIWSLREGALRFGSKANWGEWWILWRRISPGLDAQRQQALFEDVRPYLWRDGAPPPGPGRHGPVEMMQMLGALEHLDAQAKVRAGELMFERSKKLGSYWAIGRVGARALMFGTPDRVVPTETAAAWLERIMELPWEKSEGAAFAAASLARLTGDSACDIPQRLRDAVVKRLRKAKAPGNLLEIVTRVTAVGDADMRGILGESLPSGLRLG